MTNKVKGLLATHVAVLLFGTAGLFGKILPISPILIVFGRVAFASLFLALFSLCSDKKEIPEVKSGKTMVLILGVLLAVHWITFFYSIQVSNIAIGLLSFSTFPVYVILLEPLMFKERFKPQYLLFFLVVFVGLRTMIPSMQWSDRLFQGLFWGCISGLLFAILTLLNRFLSKSYSAGFLALWQNTIAFVVLFPLTLRLLGQITDIRFWFYLVLLGVVFTALSHTLFIYGLKYVKASIVSILACMEPVYGILFAFVLLNEIPERRVLLGGAIIVLTIISLTVKMSKRT
jgi:drug/metabolite transporter (DMT)-like permease